jgi:hypothetical protein
VGGGGRYQIHARKPTIGREPAACLKEPGEGRALLGSCGEEQLATRCRVALAWPVPAPA